MLFNIYIRPEKTSILGLHYNINSLKNQQHLAVEAYSSDTIIILVYSFLTIKV